jgi:cytochrome c-type biogenesis protein
LLVAIGALFHVLSATVSEVLDWVLPVLYAVVLVLGIAMLAGRNPFERLGTTSAPVLRNPAATAYVYGAFLAPMTLPCTGPLIISAFVVGGVAGTGELVDGLVYFLFFGLGFGWPLVVLPLLAAPTQQRMTRFLTRNHRAITILSGLLLIGVAAAGWWFDIRPN